MDGLFEVTPQEAKILSKLTIIICIWSQIRVPSRIYNAGRKEEFDPSTNTTAQAKVFMSW
jgi:hypothetical protein